MALRYTRGQRRMPLAPGSKLGRYDVVAFVGAGGMGEVYRARDTELGRDVAIKVLRPDRHSDDDARRRLTQEARTASALNHPHIAIVFDVAAADGVHFIVMEYVAGRPLSALIAAGLDRGEALRIAIAVSRRAGAGPRRRHRPPRSQAGQRRRLRRRRPQGPRLRDRQAGRPAGRRGAAGRDHHRAHRHGAALADQRLRRHARLRGARAGDRRQGRRPQRHLQLRLDALRDADRTARLPRRHRGRDDRRGARTPADAAARDRPGPADRARAGRAALPAQGARAPVPVDRRCPGRAPGHRRRAGQAHAG